MYCITIFQIVSYNKNDLKIVIHIYFKKATISLANASDTEVFP